MLADLRANFRHNRLYYDEDQPEISDEDYDALMRRLRDLEAAWPDLVDDASPSRIVGGTTRPTLAAVVHRCPCSVCRMYLTKKMSGTLCNGWVQLSKSLPVFVVEPKIDGLSVALRYENGLYTWLDQRRWGSHGEDVTMNLRMIENLPLTLPEPVADLEVRGEVSPFEAFERLMRDGSNGRKLFA